MNITVQCNNNPVHTYVLIRHYRDYFDDGCVLVGSCLSSIIIIAIIKDARHFYSLLIKNDEHEYCL